MTSRNSKKQRQWTLDTRSILRDNAHRTSNTGETLLRSQGDGFIMMGHSYGYTELVEFMPEHDADAWRFSTWIAMHRENARQYRDELAMQVMKATLEPTLTGLIKYPSTRLAAKYSLSRLDESQSLPSVMTCGYLLRIALERKLRFLADQETLLLRKVVGGLSFHDIYYPAPPSHPMSLVLKGEWDHKPVVYTILGTESASLSYAPPGYAVTESAAIDLSPLYVGRPLVEVEYIEKALGLEPETLYMKTGNESLVPLQEETLVSFLLLLRAHRLKWNRERENEEFASRVEEPYLSIIMHP